MPWPWKTRSGDGSPHRSTDVTDSKALELKAAEFAQELDLTFKSVLGQDCPDFVVDRLQLSGKAGPTVRLVVRPKDDAEIELTISGALALTIGCSFGCEWDREARFLKVQKADLYVSPVNEGTPLFRYEYQSSMSHQWPSAHLQIHAHRDEFLYAMLRAKRGKSKARQRPLHDGKGKIPRLSMVHFPVGGPRLRPCIEDILQMVINEFGVDCEQGAQDVLDQGRERWRRRQVSALVRDVPSEATRALRDMGYRVRPPRSGPVADRLKNLRRI